MSKRRQKRNQVDTGERKPLKALTPPQAELMEALKNERQVFVVGPAGTGKTYVCATQAADWLEQGTIDRISLVRPNVPAGPSLGFLKGTLEEKYLPWCKPFIEVIEQRLGKEVTGIMLKRGQIELVPMEIARGRSFNDGFVFIDEAQNMTVHEAFMMMTRIGRNTTVVLSGDVSQDDLKVESGFERLLNMVDDHALNVPVVEFTRDDIVRSDICRMWVDAFSNYDRNYDVYE